MKRKFYKERNIDKFNTLSTRLETSSKTNKNYSIFLLGFSTYILVTVLSTQDIKILFPELGVHLAILNVDIDIVAFSILAPMLLSIFYINNILKLKEHIALMKEYKEAFKKVNYTKHRLIPNIPFMFDFAYLNSPSNSKIFRFLTMLVLIWYTPFVIFIAIYRFEDFHNLYITMFGYVLLFIVFGFLFSFLKYLNKTLIKAKFFKDSIMPVFIVITIFVVFNAWLYYDLVFSQDSYIVKNFTLKYEIKKGIKLKYLDFLVPRIEIEPNTNLPFKNISNYKIYIHSINKLISKRNKITEETELKNLPIINLSNRNLRFIKLNYAFLPFTNFEKCDLKYGSFYCANLQGSSFKNGDLTGVDLRYTNLKKVNFEKSKLYKANLKVANIEYGNLRKADLSYANLEYGNIKYSQFYGANFTNTIVEYANIIYSDFGKVIFTETNLNKSLIFKVNFYEAKNINSMICKKCVAIEADELKTKSTIKLNEFFNVYYRHENDKNRTTTLKYNKDHIIDFLYNIIIYKPEPKQKDKYLHYKKKAKLNLFAFLNYFLKNGDIGYITIKDYQLNRIEEWVKEKEMKNIKSHNKNKMMEFAKQFTLEQFKRIKYFIETHIY